MARAPPRIKLRAGGPPCRLCPAAMKNTFHEMTIPVSPAGAGPVSFVARIRDALPGLHPSERRLAEVVLNFPGDLASYTATELAQLAHVSNATVSRFVRKVGYGSFEEARQAVRAEQQAGAALFRFGSGGAPVEGVVAGHLEQSRLNLDHTFAALSDESVDGLARALLAAPRVWIAGFRAAQPLARYLGWQILQVLPQVAVIPRDGETLAESLTAVEPEDCVVLISLRRTPRVAPALAAALAQTGAALALLSDAAEHEAVPARWRFALATAAPGPLLNHVAAMAVCNLIAARIIELSGPEGRRRMSAIESAHAALGEL